MNRRPRKIILFTDNGSLDRYLSATENPGQVAVLNLGGDCPDISTAGNILPGDAFTGEEKDHIMKEYIRHIAGLGEDNHFSTAWLCHPMSEKNELLPDNLLRQLLEFLYFHRWFLQAGDQIAAVVTPRESLHRNIIAFARLRGIEWRLEGILNRNSQGSFFLNRPLRKAASFLSNLVRCQHRFGKARFLWKSVNREAEYYIVRTWFDARSKPLLDQDRDIYFGRLPGFLKAHGHRVLYFGEFFPGFESEFRHYKGTLHNPVILERSLLQGLDLIKATLFQALIKRKIKLKPGLKILETDVDPVFRNFFQVHCRNPHIRRNYLSFLAARKLVKKINIGHFYMPHENYGWEKLTRIAIGNSGKKIPVTAFQHAQVVPNSTKLSLGSDEGSAPFLPDRLITPGGFTRQFLIRQRNYPEGLVAAGCALRQDHPVMEEPVPRRKNRRILVQLWSVERSALLINFIYESKIHPAPYTVTLNFHPCNPLETVRSYLDFEYNDHFETAGDSLEDNFKRHDLVIYHGSTTCLEALAHGLPVINVDFGDPFPVDPLFGFEAFKWTVRRPGELEETIRNIYALPDETFYRKQQRGFDFVKEYFYPVTDRKLEAFL